MRCEKFGYPCDGYETAPRYVETRRLLPKRLLPKSNVTVNPTPPTKELTRRGFRTEDEFMCFRCYSEDVAPKLSTSKRTVWSQLLLQAGQYEPFIQQAIIALGGLNRSLKYMGKGTQSPDFNTILERRHLHAKYHHFALKHYDKFLQDARGYLSKTTKEDGRRMAMIVCLLVVCFEGMQYHHESGLKHAQSGLEVFDEFTASEGNIRNSSAGPAAIEDELVEQFKGMDLYVLGHFDGRGPEVHRRLKCDGDMNMQKMPEVFKDVDQAAWYLELIIRRAIHFVLWELKSQEKSDLEPEIHAAEFRRWAQASGLLLRSAIRNPNAPDSLDMLLLKMQSVAIEVRHAAHVAGSELAYDKYEAEFENIVNWGKLVFSNPRFDARFVEGGFCFEGGPRGLISPLIGVVYRCRHRRIRREAIELLKARHWREAGWDSQQVAEVAMFQAEIEEDGVETDIIPEWARVWVKGVKVNFEEGTFTVSYVRGIGESAVHGQDTRDWKSLGGSRF